MPKRLFITLFFLCPITFTAASRQSYAQQTGMAQNAQASPAVLEPLQPVTSTDFWDGDEPNVVNLLRHPFASKKYVLRHTVPIRERLNELEELTASNKREIREIDENSQRGIQLASEKTTLADLHATDAAKQAQAAQSSAAQATTLLGGAEQMIGNVDTYRSEAQTEIYFRAGNTVLSSQAKGALDQISGPLKDQHSYIVELHGFAAGGGQMAIASSRMMAEAVVRYLVNQHQIPLYRIFTIGMGSAAEAGERPKHISGGRVEVNVLKNETLSSAQR